MTPLEIELRAKRDAGEKLLAIYLTAGCREDWVQLVLATARGGADIIEIGLPFSDPVMDGPIIQAASDAALRGGVTIASLLDELGSVEVPSLMVSMTYYNLALHRGEESFARDLRRAGILGAILADLPFDESDAWRAGAMAADIAPILLAAPTSSDDRLAEIMRRGSGFVYAISRMGITGVQTSLSDDALAIAERLRVHGDVPVLVGIGVSTPEQARAVAAVSDGAIVGSALMGPIMDGASAAEVEALVREFKTAL